MPAVSDGAVSAYGYYEMGFGERTFEPVAGDRFGHSVGMRATFGSALTGRETSRSLMHTAFASGADRPLPARNGDVRRSAVGFAL